MSLRGSRLPSRWFVRPVILGIAAFLTLLAATGFLGVRYWHERQVASRAVEHSRQVIETLDRVRVCIADLETERRGYLLTLNPTYLNPYGASAEAVRREIDALQALVADDPLQSLRAGHLALVVAAKLQQMDEVLNTTRTSSLEAALAMLRSMDEIRSQIDQMLDIERFSLARSQTRRGRAARKHHRSDCLGSRHRDHFCLRSGRASPARSELAAGGHRREYTSL